MAALTIGALAKEAGVGVETVRFYERRGLIGRPERPRTGYRSYPPDSIGRIRFIRNAQAFGFTLDEIKDLLTLSTTSKTSCAAVRSRARAKFGEIERRLAEMDRARSELQALIATCPGQGDVAKCSILQALRSSEPSIKRRGRRGAGVSPMESVELSVDGMECDGCADTVRAVLRREAGVQETKVSFKDRTAQVLYDRRETDAARLVAAMSKAGFSAKARA